MFDSRKNFCAFTSKENLNKISRLFTIFFCAITSKIYFSSFLMDLPGCFSNLSISRDVSVFQLEDPRRTGSPNKALNSSRKNADTLQDDDEEENWNLWKSKGKRTWNVLYVWNQKWGLFYRRWNGMRCVVSGLCWEEQNAVPWTVCLAISGARIDLLGYGGTICDFNLNADEHF